MRLFPRLLASVKAAKYLEPGAPTGLTGLLTHRAPRSELLYLYHTTLDRLKALPESSVYRQSTEALTRHRLHIVESIKPDGYDAWVERSRKRLAEHPELFKPSRNVVDDGERPPIAVQRGGKTFVAVVADRPDPATLEWNGEEDVGPALEGTRTQEERDAERKYILLQGKQEGEVHIDWEPEPQLTADQVAEVENKIGAGLIEEVIQVADGELRLVDIMAEARVWEPLEEKPPEGQWQYFERGTYTGKT